MHLLKIMKRIYRKLKRPPLSDEEIIARTIGRIRDGGGTVGENVHIVCGSSIDMGQPYLLSIGNNVTITHASVLTHDASLIKTIGYSKVGKVHIGNDVFVGWGSIILPDTTIGNRVVIGAGTVVAKDIPDNCVVIGNPCRILCTYDEYVEKSEGLMRQAPVIDRKPDEIMEDPETIGILKKNGFGYIK